MTGFLFTPALEDIEVSIATMPTSALDALCSQLPSLYVGGQAARERIQEAITARREQLGTDQ